MTGDALPAPWRLIALETVGSTNDEAKRLIAEGRAADFVVVSAREQSAGRGRRGRAWLGGAGNLYCSFILAVGADFQAAAQAGFVAAVALVDALRGLVPQAAIGGKWPNDVLAGGAKLAGMLLEPAGAGWLVLGVGVNVAWAPPAHLVERPATSLAVLGYDGDPGKVLAAFCAAFAPWMERWRGEGFPPVRRAWLDRALGLSGPVDVRLANETLSGTFAGIDGDGALILDMAGGEVRRILAGDVFLPPAVFRHED